MPTTTKFSELPDYVKELDGQYLLQNNCGELTTTTSRDFCPTLCSLVDCDDVGFKLKISDTEYISVCRTTLFNGSQQLYIPQIGENMIYRAA